jgi:hypothetical protein
MKLIATIAAVLTLTACGTTSQEAYYKAIEARETRLAQQELRTDSAIAEMAAKGDAQAKGMGLMYFALKNAGAKQNQQAIAAPKSTAEALLPWAALIVPSITQFYSITKNADIAINSSNNALTSKLSSDSTSLEAKKADNNMIVDLVQGRGPIIGTEDDVLLWPVTPAVEPVVEPVVE